MATIKVNKRKVLQRVKKRMAKLEQQRNGGLRRLSNQAIIRAMEADSDCPSCSCCNCCG